MLSEAVGEDQLVCYWRLALSSMQKSEGSVAATKIIDRIVSDMPTSTIERKQLKIVGRM
jgi:hypothetical protein